VATFFAAAGAKPHPEYPLDGIDLGAVLRDPAAAAPRELFWRMSHRRQRAVRAGDWKYLSMDGYDYLFNLAQDARERANVARRFPERLAELRAKYDVWAATMPPIPADAGVSLIGGDADMPKPTG
jgi:arylsulfatase A-like enzyme